MPRVLFSVDGSVATATVSDDYADHRFEIVRDKDSISIEYQETQLGRGTVVVLDPPYEVRKVLTGSEQFKEFAKPALQ